MKQVYVVFTSLLIDLLAFTTILPLLPKIFDFYESNKNDSVYNYLQYEVDNFREFFIGSTNKGFNSVLFGGFIGSLFSFLQFISSSITGAVSDFYGRKTVLLLTLIGTLISYMLWSVSSVFIIFLLSRIIGGVSKSNVSLCISIMTDITDLNNRSFAMALVGIAFSLGFIFGPLIGVFFSTITTSSANSNIFMYPAYFSIALNVLNILFVIAFYEESLPVENRAKSFISNLNQSFQYINPISLFNFKPVKKVKEQDLNKLRKIGFAYFLYLFIYSGLEFTLTFLVHYRFNYNSMQQGKMFLFIGVIMSLIQGGYVRRIKQGSHLGAAIKAIYLLIPAFVLVALAKYPFMLYLGLALYSYASAVVVSCLTVIVSSYGDVDEKGTIMGIFRSLGALARALGPFFASIAYWSMGVEFAYISGGCALILPLYILIKTKNDKIKAN